ncbi:MAG: hypothetical protein AAF558_01935 [Verrucomicrobiota bacterium]
MIWKLGLGLLVGGLSIWGGTLHATGLDKSKEGVKDRKKFERQIKNRFTPKPFLMAGDKRFEKMLQLALADEDQLSNAFDQWPGMESLDDRAKRMFTRRVKGFRDRLRREALEEAKNLEITLEEREKNEFIRSYWQQRMQIERRIRQNAEEELKSSMKPIREGLKKEWGK